MKKIFSLLVLIGLFSINAYSQFIHKIKADSVLITNDSCNAELNLENSTKDTLGFLYNKGNGRTEFRRGLIRLYDSLYVIGKDTLDIAKGASGNFIRNQNTAAQSANAWISGKFAIGTAAFTTAKLELATPNNTEAFKSTITDGSILSHKGAQGNFSLTPVGTNTVGSIYADGNLSTLGVRSLAGSLVGRMYQSSGSFFIEAPNSGLSLTSLNMAQTSGSINLLRLGAGGFQPTSGNAIFNALHIQPILNQTGTANGNIFGVFYNPTVTSVLGTHYGLYINSGINYLAGRTTIGSSTFVTDETLNVNGTAQVRKTFNSTTPIPASGSPIGVTGVITVNSGSHATRDIAGVYGNVTLQPGTGNNLPVSNYAAGLTGHLVLGNAALTVGSTVPKYQAIYASISGQSTTGTYDNIALISTDGGMSAGATITNLYHLYLGSITGSGGVSGVTNYWGIYQASGNKNYFSGNVLIGSNTDVPSSKLTVTSTTQGFLKPRMTTTQRDAIASPATGLSIYNTTLKTNDTYNGSEYFSFGNQIILPATNTPAGTTGNQTINKVTGTVNIAAAGTTVTVNNNLVNANSIVTAVLRTNDATAYIKNVVPGAGTITINLGAAATAEVSVGFVVFN